MAYSTDNPPRVVQITKGSTSYRRGRSWIYYSSDNITEVLASGYFTDGAALGMQVDDPIEVVDLSNDRRYSCVVAAVSTSATIKLGAQGWQNLTADIVTRGIGATDPTWAVVSGGNFSAYQFAINDEAWAHYNLPHDMLPNSDLYFSLHWFQDGTNTQDIKWSIDYTMARVNVVGGEQFSATGTNITLTDTPPGVALEHVQTFAPVISSNTIDPDAQIMVHIQRLTNGGTDNTDGIFVLELDLGYESIGVGTPLRIRPFY